MSGDWVKMRTDLYRDPKVSLMADLLMSEDGALAAFVGQMTQCGMAVTRNVMRNTVVGALVSTWGVMRLRGVPNGIDLECAGATVEVIDDIADLPGFGVAMASVGWVLETPESLVFPRFFESYNVDPQKEKNAERQRRFRERQRQNRPDAPSVTKALRVTPREEKRRDVNRTPPYPLAGSNRTTSPATPAAGKAGGVREGVEAGFDAFWGAYPRKDAKQAARKAWQKLAPDAALTERISAGLKRAKASAQWQEEGGRFVPYASTWLNGCRWDDEPAPAAASASRPSTKGDRGSEAELRAQGKALGLEARPGEDWAAYRARIDAARAARQRRAP